MKKQTREWQSEAIAQAIATYDSGERKFLVNAAPGAGKTYMAALLAKELIDRGLIDRVFTIAPRKKIVTQWARQFRKVTNRNMMKVTGKYFEHIDPAHMEDDIAATWAGIKAMKDVLQVICKNSRVLVIGDEIHHAALGAVWGDDTSSALHDASYVLALTGTPVRSDGITPIWLDDAHNLMANPRQTYNLKYQVAIKERWCVPVTVHRHAGNIEVLSGDDVIQVKDTGTIFPKGMNVTSGMKRKLRFDKVINVPLWDETGLLPRRESYHASMMRWAGGKLDELRSREYGKFGMPNAGGLVIAPGIEEAKYFAELIRLLWPDENPDVVHSGMGTAAESVIDSFSRGTKKWIVAVNMISEGVDIPRLRVMVLLPSSRTELFFRQAIGRIIRKDDGNGNPDDDNSRAYCVVPQIGRELIGKDCFIEFAKRLEEDMGPIEPPVPPPPPRCPECGAEGVKPRHGHPCPECGYEPPYIEDRWTCSPWSDDGCGAINEGGATCHACGMPRHKPITLGEAMGYRDGVIARQQEVSEKEARESEELAPSIQEELEEADPRVRELMALVPEEMYSLMEPVFEAAREKRRKKGKSVH